MRATPSFRRLPSTITRPPSRAVMCEVSIAAPSAMPTRSAPSSRALSFISFELRFFLLMFNFLLLPEFLELFRHHSLVTLGPYPAHVPFREPRYRLAFLAVGLPLLAERDLLRRALRDLLLEFREMRVVVIAHRADREAARAVAEGADHAQQALPEAEQVALLQHRDRKSTRL